MPNSTPLTLPRPIVTPLTLERGEIVLSNSEAHLELSPSTSHQPQILSHSYLETPQYHENDPDDDDDSNLYDEESLFFDLQDTSGLDTSDIGIRSASLAMAPGDYVSFATVIRGAAEVLDLTLTTAEVETNVLTQVLHSEQSAQEPHRHTAGHLGKARFLPYSQQADCKMAQACSGGDPAFLLQYPSPESLVVQTFTS